MITIAGISIALTMGISKDFIKKQKCVHFVGVTGAGGYAFKVPCTAVRVAATDIPATHIYVPFELIEGTNTYKFVNKTKYLIGTDILRNYHLSLTFSAEYGSGNVKDSILSLIPHGLVLPDLKDTEYSLTQIAPNAEELTIT